MANICDREEHIAGKGKKMLVFSISFSHSVYKGPTGLLKVVIVWKRDNSWIYPKKKSFQDEISPFTRRQNLALSKLKFANNNFSVAQIIQFFSDGVENIVGKGEKASFSGL